MPANTINDLDFFLSDVNVWKANTVRLCEKGCDSLVQTICLVACAVAEFLIDWCIAASASIVSGK